MKIIYIAHSTEPDGSSFCLLNILDALSEFKKIDPIVTVPNNGFLVNELNKRGIRHVQVSFFFGCYPKNDTIKDTFLFIPRLIKHVLKNLFTVFHLWILFYKEKPDLIHSNTGVVHVGAFAAAIMGIPHVWHLREYQDIGLALHIFPSKSFFIHFLRYHNNYPIAISNGLYAHYKLKAPAIMIYDGVRLKKDMRAVQKYDRKKYFFFAGALTPNKGIFSLLNAYIEFSKQNTSINLKIAGEAISSDFLERIYRFIKINKMEDRVELLGYCPNIDLMLQNAKALIVPSFFEGFGRITAEALLNYCPVIGRNCGGTAEILNDAPFGILFNTDEELFPSMMKLCSMPEKYIDEKVQEAHTYAMNLFSAETNALAIYDLYGNILSNRALRGRKI